MVDHKNNTLLTAGDDRQVTFWKWDCPREKMNLMYLHYMTEVGYHSRVGLYSCEEVVELL